MGTTTRQNPATTISSFLQPYSPATSIARGQQATKPAMSVAPKPAQNMSVAPKVNTALQSGYGPQYGNNPLNQPAPVAKPSPTVSDWMSKTNALNARTSKFYNDSEATRLQQQKDRYNDTVGIQNTMFDNANNDLRGEIPRLDERFGKFESGVRANMAEADQIGSEQKTNAQTYTGSAQRTAMENKRQTDAQREKQYAALGTIDSYGTGSFTQGNANADTEFTKGTQGRYDALAQNMTEIDRTVANAKREALGLIDQERTKYEDTVRQINTQLRDNEVGRKAALTEAYYSTQEAISGIQDQYEGLRIAQEQQKLTFEQEMEKLTAENTMPTVSDWFKQTGQPQTQDDFNFIIKNPTGATALQKMIAGNGGKTKSSTQLQVEGKAGAGLRALDTVEAEIINNPGILTQASVWGSPGARQYEAAVSSITDALGGLRTGASVSPEQQKFYRNLLPKQGDSKETIEYKLNALRQELQGYSQGSTSMGTEVPDELMTILGLG